MEEAMGEIKGIVPGRVDPGGSGERLQTVLRRARADGMLTARDTDSVQGRLWLLLARQTARYTMGESSSVPAETADALFAGVCYHIGVGLGGDYVDGVSKLKSGDLSALFEAGRREVGALVSHGKGLLAQAQRTALDVDNISYHDTLRELGLFFRRYDTDFLPQDIPCMIDYQLSSAISEELCGIKFINAYLRRLIAENMFCAHFPARAVKRLLSASYPDYREFLINLYEPVYVNAVGLALLDRPPFSLEISDADRAALMARFYPWNRDTAAECLRDATHKLRKAMAIRDYALIALLKDSEKPLLTQLELVKASGRFDNVFPGLGETGQARPDPLFQDGARMEDGALRELIAELQACGALQAKLELFRKHVRGVQDFVEVLGTCFWGEEHTALFQAMEEAELALLLRELSRKNGAGPADWGTAPDWGIRLMRYVQSLDSEAQNRILHILDADLPR